MEKKKNARVWGFLEADFNVRTVRCVWAKSLSRVRCSATPRTVAHQVPLFIGFSRREDWGGLSCSPPGDLPTPGIEPASPASPTLAARVLGWIVMLSWGSPHPRDRACVSYVSRTGSPSTGVDCHALLLGISPPQGSSLRLLRLPHWQPGSLALGPPGEPQLEIRKRPN